MGATQCMRHSDSSPGQTPPGRNTTRTGRMCSSWSSLLCCVRLGGLTCSAQSRASRAGCSPSESSSELEPLRCVQYRRVGVLRLRRLESRCECQTCQRACVCNSVSIGYVLLYSVLLLTRCLKMLYVAVGIR